MSRHHKKPTKILPPTNDHSLSKSDLSKFKAYLRGRGCEVVLPKSEWEVLRFKANRGTHIVYCNSKGRLRWMGESDAAWRAWKGDGRWKVSRPNGRRPPDAIMNLVDRDGRLCFFCAKILHEEANKGEDQHMTVEHLLSSVHGGKNRLENLAIACQPCNLEAGHKTVVEKVALRDQKRGGPCAAKSVRDTRDESDGAAGSAIEESVESAPSVERAAAGK